MNSSGTGYNALYPHFELFKTEVHRVVRPFMAKNDHNDRCTRLLNCSKGAYFALYAAPDRSGEAYKACTRVLFNQKLTYGPLTGVLKRSKQRYSALYVVTEA